MTYPKLFPKLTLFLDFPLLSTLASISAIRNNILFINGTDLSSYSMMIHSCGILTLIDNWKKCWKSSQVTFFPENKPICFCKNLFSTCKFMSYRDHWSKCLLPMVNIHSANLSVSARHQATFCPSARAARARVTASHLITILSHCISKACLWRTISPSCYGKESGQPA